MKNEKKMPIHINYKMIFIPKGVYKIIISMKMEMEMAEQVAIEVKQLDDFYNMIKNRGIHYSFHFSNTFCFLTKEIDVIIPFIHKLNHIVLYQKNNKPWFYLIYKLSKYQEKLISKTNEILYVWNKEHQFIWNDQYQFVL